MKLGSHVKMRGKEMFLGSAKEAASYGANAMMIYTGAPQNTVRKDLSLMKIEEGKKYMEDHGIEEVVVHAPYIVNLGNNKDQSKYEFAIEFLANELKRADALGAKQVTLHPGAHVGLGAKAAIENIAHGLDEALKASKDVSVALETMAGKGTEIGRTFEELSEIIEKCSENGRLSVTFDTCHANDAGYDVKNGFDDVLNEFDQIIGLNRLKVVHLNDSKNECGAHKDRHANIGFGTIGFDSLNYIAHHPQLEAVPKIMETPYVGEDKKNSFAPYAYEIAMLKNQAFDSKMLDKVKDSQGIL
ncbi:deoxyribonuclease IV [uncultured Ligilactobacillus sp.]|uniref:deoxyribonuclease IV n=1 Tax=uncultured Ligilactobacillus sp. TaxID=2837633 RepID=UPI002595288D|nr:deoxyribonuclease IV [uncultured Ligilactobacillus sp.]